MSITDEIRACVTAHEGKRLFHLPLLLPGEYAMREMIVSKEVSEAVTPPWPENYEALRRSGFRGELDAFTQGDEFSVAEDPFKKPGHTMLARVHPVSDEIWDVRSTDPNPGIRGLGAFGGKDFFIALTWNYRENFKDEDADYWTDEIERCKAKWSELFGSVPRFKGASLDEYISNYYAV